MAAAVGSDQCRLPGRNNGVRRKISKSVTKPRISSCQGIDGKTYSLADLKGKTVVLAWFPKAFTGG